jgi:hypothetical protein
MYTAKDFYRIDKVHPYMMLWLYNRRDEIRDELRDEYLNSLDDDDEVDFRRVVRIGKLSLERLQQETGLSNDDLDRFYSFGMVIAEYEMMRSMSEYEREEYIDLEYNTDFDEDSCTDEEREMLKGVTTEIIQAIKEFVSKKDLEDDIFKNIVETNFQEKDDTNE